VFEPTNKELGLDKRRSCLGWLEAKSLFYAQYVEYKISHYIDKAFESFFGFVSVLPGAFSTFRWEAIKGDPLKSFFNGLNKESHTATEANMYLAEDRIMCLEIVKKLSKNWILKYEPNCIALTDPPLTIIEFIKQRRRWTNGSLFASWYVIDHLNEITRSAHSKRIKAGFFFLYIIMILNFIFSLTLVGSMFSMFYVFTISIFGCKETEDGDLDFNSNDKCKDHDDIGYNYEYMMIENIIITIYIAMLFTFCIMSLTKPIEKSNRVYRLFVLVFGIFIFIVIGNSYKRFTENLGTFSGGILAISLLASYISPLILSRCGMNICKYLIGT
jgi:cellulose synthase/poly-beta-1,6-N-acetylglucosamine synthase-like glycosyltransferase